MSKFARHLYRVQYAFSVTVLLIGAMVVADMLFRFGIGTFVFSPTFGGLLFGISYLLVPVLEKKLKLFG